MKFYQQQIVAVTGCGEAEAREVEEIMRDECHTLGHLSRSQFAALAKQCLDAMRQGVVSVRTEPSAKVVAP